MTTGDGLAAWLRQSRIEVITDAVLRRAPRPLAPQFEGLLELLFCCDGIERLLAEHPVALETRQPGVWELAYRRRQPPCDATALPLSIRRD